MRGDERHASFRSTSARGNERRKIFSSFGWHSTVHDPALTITSGTQEANMISSPSPCSGYTNIERPASGEPSHSGHGRSFAHLLRGDALRASYSGQPSA